MKRCPFCAEEIQDAAIICKHCKRDLVAVPSPTVIGAPLVAESTMKGAAPALSPAASLGGVIVSVGLFLLFLGGSEYYGGSTTQNMFKGTILERDADTNRIMDNTMSGGMTKMGYGIIALLLGAGIAAAGKRITAAESSAQSAPTTVRPVVAVGIILAILIALWAWAFLTA